MESDKIRKVEDVPSGQVLKLIEQIQYQEGAIVARILIDKANGSCRLVALDKGQGRSEHTAPFDAFVYLLDGEAEVTISGRPLHLK
ncbi:cupin domain-containing protein [Chloroflexota bacterium]